MASPIMFPALWRLGYLRVPTIQRSIMAVSDYQSPTSGQENILIDISVREPLLLPVVKAPAKTLLLDPLTGNAAVSAVPVRNRSRVK